MLRSGTSSSEYDARQSASRGFPRRFSACAAFIVLMCVPTIRLQGVPHGNTELRELKKRQKQQRKIARQQQQAMERVLKQHPQTVASRKRHQRDLKLQSRLLRKNQKNQALRLKQKRRFLKDARFGHARGD